MTKKHEDELGDEQLDQVAGGLMPANVEIPNVKVTRKSSDLGGADPTPGFMDFTDDCCMN